MNRKVLGVVACQSKWTFIPPFPETTEKGQACAPEVWLDVRLTGVSGSPSTLSRDSWKGPAHRLGGS